MRLIAYTSDYRVDEDGDYLERLTVRDLSSGEQLFDITANEGGGDYRGYPANVFSNIVLTWQQRGLTDDDGNLLDLNDYLIHEGYECEVKEDEVFLLE